MTKHFKLGEPWRLISAREIQGASCICCFLHDQRVLKKQYSLLPQNWSQRMRIARAVQFLSLFSENKRRIGFCWGIWVWKDKQWQEIWLKNGFFAPFHSRRLKIRGNTPDLIAHSARSIYASEWQSISSLAGHDDSLMPEKYRVLCAYVIFSMMTDFW